MLGVIIPKKGEIIMKGIMFKESLFEALISGKKTQTRRDTAYKNKVFYLKEPYFMTENYDVIYRYGNDNYNTNIKWKNKMFMPEEYARYSFEITGVKQEYLQDISDDDCIKEGAIEWLLEYTKQKAPKILQKHETEYRIASKYYNYDNGFSYCYNCGMKELKKLKKNAKNKFVLYGGEDFLDHEYFPDCYICNKVLLANIIDTEKFIRDYIDEFIKEQNYYLGYDLLLVLYQNDIDNYESIKNLPRFAFASMFNIFNGKGAWEKNPLVYVYDFIISANFDI
jgi:hypothetical protein